MGSDLKKTLGHAGIYSIGIILNRAVSFLMLPIYTRYLTPSDYGTIELLEMTVDVISIFAGLGVIQGLAKFYYQCQTEREKSGLVSTLFLMVLGLFLLTCLAGMAASPAISSLIFGSEAYALFLSIAFVNLFLQFVIYVPLAYIRTQQKSVFFVVVSSVKMVLQLGLNILLVVYWEMGVLGVLYSTLLSSLLIGVWLSLYTFSRVKLHFDGGVARQLFKFGWPFVFTGLGAFVLTYSDRYFLNYYRDLSEVGIYALAYKFGFLLMMFPVNPVMNIWLVQRFELVQREGYERMFNQFLSWFFIVSLAVALGLSLVVHDGLKIMSAPAFWGAAGVVPIILLAYFFQACTDFFNFGIYHRGETQHMAYGTLLAAVVILVLSFLLIPAYGVYGAAWATLASFAMRLAYVYWASQKLFKIRFEWGRPLATGFMAVLIYLAYWAGLKGFPAIDKIYWSFPMALLFLLLFFFSLFKLNIISSEEKRAILSSVKAPLRVLSEIKGLSA